MKHEEFLKQLAEDCLPEDLIDVQGAYRRFNSAANPEAVLGLIARIESLEAALQFYADHNNWMVTRKDDLHEAKRTIVGDVDSYGYQRDEYSPNILQIIGGKTAREALEGDT